MSGESNMSVSTVICLNITRQKISPVGWWQLPVHSLEFNFVLEDLGVSAKINDDAKPHF